MKIIFLIISKKKIPQIYIDRCDVIISKNIKTNYFEIDIDELKFSINYYDLIYSNCFLHMTNDFANTLKAILNSLKPNGFFIGIIPNIENMYQLVNSMYEADNSFYKGSFQRFNPTMEIDNILSILKKLNFDIPSIYNDTISIDYKNFNKLIKEVKKMNLSYCHLDKKQTFENKLYFKKLENIYRNRYFDETYPLDVKINIISAWKK